MNETGHALGSLCCDGCELLSEVQKPLFSIRLRMRDHSARVLTAEDAAKVVALQEGDNSAVLCYDIPVCEETNAVLRVRVEICGGERITFRIGAEQVAGDIAHASGDYAVEWIEFPSVTYAPHLRAQGGDASVLWPYNEGALIEDAACKPGLTDVDFPTQGWFPMFPNMIFTQFTAFLRKEYGIYMGAHDASYAPKAIDFACGENGVEFRTRIFCGGEYGAGVESWFDTVWEAVSGDWEDAAEVYRRAFAEVIRPSLPKVAENDALPAWYRDDMPLVLTYPVRGQHDMDKMDPNRLFPYENVRPYVEEFAARTGCRVMVLLMHWEGTAPWAPPYVWPPYGGEEMFDAFMQKLHASGNLLGVYCSGLGFTAQSNLIAEYNCTADIEKRALWRGMTKAPDQTVQYSRICTCQRSGYDLCPASTVGKEILNEALLPLLTSGVDYVQALDQNHGGTMYFCYAEDHGHPPVPGAWMTSETHDLLNGWKNTNRNTLLGCESAAAEPNIDALPLSDNRYELCYSYGKAVPLYAYLFHPYLHNFMGNQVSCPLGADTESLLYRLAYSFLAGDLLTLVLNDGGDVDARWGMRDFTVKPDRDAAIAFCAQAHAFHVMYPSLFRDGVMRKPISYQTDLCQIPVYGTAHPFFEEKAVLATAWKHEGGTVQLLANYTNADRQVHFCLTGEGTFTAVYANGERLTCQRSVDAMLTIPAQSVLAVEF